jgi:Flp pilus assembly protein TadG
MIDKGQPNSRIRKHIDGCTPIATCVSGSIGLIAAASIAVLCGVVGLAVDFGSAHRVRTQLQAALDAAVIASAQQKGSDAVQLETYARKHFKANGGDDTRIEGLTFAVSKNPADKSLTLTVTGGLPNYFLPVIGFDTTHLTVSASARGQTPDLEVALVLDNTGSMRTYMNELRTSASDLVDTLFDNAADPNKLKIAVVPYVGAVNIGNGATRRGWMDNFANAQWHGRSFANLYIATQSGCVPDPNPNAGPATGPGLGTGGSDRSSLDQATTKFAAVIRELFGVQSALAAPPPPAVPSGYSIDLSLGCWLLKNPVKVNHFDLFARIPGGAWKGCVEARAEPYDVTIAPPDATNPDTLFVPYFWPDEIDQSIPGVKKFPNDYQTDGVTPPGWTAIDDWSGVRNIWKYANASNAISVLPPFTKGPNQACPDEILPLNSDRAATKSMISLLSHWEGSGTVSSEGLMWGWRVLDPASGTFTQGKPVGQASKVIVLMTDGANAAAEQESYSTFTDYTAYGYLRAGRFVGESYDTYQRHLNARLALACTNAKDAGMRIFTVTFGVTNPAINSLYEKCASDPPLAYNARTSEELAKAFKDIAANLSQTRLSQ